MEVIAMRECLVFKLSLKKLYSVTRSWKTDGFIVTGWNHSLVDYFYSHNSKAQMIMQCRYWEGSMKKYNDLNFIVHFRTNNGEYSAMIRDHRLNGL